jgi:hypothetical protein
MSLFTELMEAWRADISRALADIGVVGTRISGSSISGTLPAHASTHESGGADEIDCTGLTGAGGSGSGDVATDTIWDAKGDIVAGTGSDTASRLAVGSNDQVLTADSSTATGLKWAAAAAGASTFAALTDTPASYSGQGGKYVAVKAAEDGLEFL